MDVRVLAASHKDLVQEIKSGNFREDLFYRLERDPDKTAAAERERKNDIPLLVDYFLKLFAAARNQDLQGLSSEAFRVLLNYSWPGNVRELENSIKHAVVLAKAGQVEARDLPAAIQSSLPGVSPTLSRRKRKALLEILEECGWNKKMASPAPGHKPQHPLSYAEKAQDFRLQTHHPLIHNLFQHIYWCLKASGTSESRTQPFI